MVFKKGNRLAKIHGESNSPLYIRWISMKDRCNNPNNRNYKNYGGRGITYASEWETYENFAKDMRPTFREDLTLERIDNSRGYSKENCRWVNRKTQNRNRRSNLLITYKGKTYVLAEWAELLGMKPNTLTYRLRRGWALEKALKTKLK